MNDTVLLVLNDDSGQYLSVREFVPVPGEEVPAAWRLRYMREVPRDLWERFQAAEERYNGLLAEIEQMEPLAGPPKEMQGAKYAPASVSSAVHTHSELTLQKNDGPARRV